MGYLPGGSGSCLASGPDPGSTGPGTEPGSAEVRPGERSAKATREVTR